MNKKEKQNNHQQDAHQEKISQKENSKDQISSDEQIKKLSEQIQNLEKENKELKELVQKYEPSHQKLTQYSLDLNYLNKQKENFLNDKKFASQKFIQLILEPVDLLNKVLKMAENASSEIKQWAYGFQMIANQLNSALEKENVQIISTNIGEVYNGSYHHIIDEHETEAHPPGTVVEVLSQGYKMHDRVIKHALVKVAKQPSKTNDENKQEIKN